MFKQTLQEAATTNYSEEQAANNKDQTARNLFEAVSKHCQGHEVLPADRIFDMFLKFVSEQCADNLLSDSSL